MAQDYPGLPLSAGRKEIRVLELLPSTLDCGSEPSCLLHTVSLLQQPKPRYSALSYVWGDPTATGSILLNGRSHTVTKNLASVLRFLTAFRRDRLCDFRLWADAICIDQSMEPENHEKNEQVSMMGDIFANAEEVLSWLGESASIPKCFHTLVMLHKGTANAGSDLHPSESDRLKAYPEIYAEDVPGNEKWICPSQTWASILKFVELPYWSRMWIFQELMLAQPGKLLFLTPVEPYSITGDDLRLALGIIGLSGHHFHQQADPDYIAENMMEHLLAFGDLGDACKYVNRRLAIRSRLHERGVSRADRASLCVLSAFGHNTRASNPLDYYYSLLGVSQLNLIPDYHSTNQVEMVCVEFVRAYLDATSGYPNALLFLHDALGSDAKAHCLPSWAPRYHLCSRDPEFHGRRLDYGAGAYRGVFEHAPGIGGLRARLEGLKLLTEGVRVGTVNLVVDQIPAATDSYLSDFERRNNGRYVTGISCTTAYFGTLMMDETVEYGIWKSRLTKRIFSGFSDHDCDREKDSWRYLKDTYLHCLHEALLHSEAEAMTGTSE